VNFGKNNVSYTCTFFVVIGRKSAYNFIYDLHSSRWHFQARWTIEMSMGTFKAAMDVCSTAQNIMSMLCIVFYYSRIFY